MKAAIDNVHERKILIKESGLKAGRALDVGIGDCACMSFVLAAGGFEVTGIDKSSQTVHAVRLGATKRFFKGSFTARRMDAERMRFADGEFDVVLAFRSLHHVKDAARVLHEMYRVCRTGGALLIAELNDRGQREFEHTRDGGRLVARIERILHKLTCSVRKMETRQHTLLACRK